MLVDKPAGPTSHDVVALLRRRLATPRAGHTGTLDPFATGLLPVLLGRATRLAPFLGELEKTYVGEIVLGVRTTTDDGTGQVITADEGWRALSDATLRTAMGEFVGVIRQRPPAFSAKKVAGRRAYRLARRGVALELEARTVHVYDWELLGRDGNVVYFRATVGRGTYLRALARDLGERLGCGAHLRALRRTHVGPFSVSEASPPDRVSPAHIGPPLMAVPHLPRVALDAALRARAAHGQPIHYPDGPALAALTADGELIAVARREGMHLKPRVVLVG